METVLDKEIKELVYILKYAKIEIVVFEDLDRFNNLKIFTKLRELNFCLNAAKKEKNITRFFYLITDSLFAEAEERTKFFDFIISVLPILNSNNSKQKLEEFLSEINLQQDDNFINNQNNNENYKKLSNNLISLICLYINDMRLLKNIINEYLSYYQIIHTNDTNIEVDKLFSIVVIKNIFIKEYDELLKNKGNLYRMMSSISNLRDELKYKYIDQNENLCGKIKILKNKIENDWFEFLAIKSPIRILSNLRCDTNNSFAYCLREWFYDQNNKQRWIGNQNVNFNDFINILTREGYIDKDDILNYKNFRLNKKDVINIYKEQIKENDQKIKNFSIAGFNELLNEINDQKINQIFSYERENKNYGLIKSLFLENFIDENYWYYVGYIYEGNLHLNDLKFLRNLKERNEQDLFLKLNNPMLVYEELNDDDYLRSNIINYDLLIVTIEKENKDRIRNLFQMVLEKDKIFNISYVLEKLEYYQMKKIFEWIFFEFENLIIRVIEKNNGKPAAVFLSLICSQKSIYYEKLKQYKLLIEKKSIVLNEIDNLSDNEKELFWNNLIKLKIKFENLENISDQKSLEKIEQNSLFKLTSLNLMHLLINLDNNDNINISLSTIISDCYKSGSLQKTKNYLDQHFDQFIEYDYISTILNHEAKIQFKNDEKETLKIFDSKISDQAKKQYYLNNQTKFDIQKIKNKKWLESLAKEDKLTQNNYETKKQSLIPKDKNIKIIQQQEFNTKELIKNLQLIGEDFDWKLSFLIIKKKNQIQISFEFDLNLATEIKNQHEWFDYVFEEINTENRFTVNTFKNKFPLDWRYKNNFLFYSFSTDIPKVNRKFIFHSKKIERPKYIYIFKSGNPLNIESWEKYDLNEK